MTSPATIGQPLATSAMLHANPDGSEVEMLAWDVRNTFGLHFLPDGRLLAAAQGANDRGSRPVGKGNSGAIWHISDL